MNPHSLFSRRILSPLRLPIPPLAHINHSFLAFFECSPWSHSRTEFLFHRNSWRRGPDSHRCTRFCRPLPSCSATAPLDDPFLRLIAALTSGNHVSYHTHKKMSIAFLLPGYRPVQVQHISSSAQMVLSLPPDNRLAGMVLDVKPGGIHIIRLF